MAEPIRNFSALGPKPCDLGEHGRMKIVARLSLNTPSFAMWRSGHVIIIIIYIYSLIVNMWDEDKTLMNLCAFTCFSCGMPPKAICWDTSVGHLHNDSLESYRAVRNPRQDDPLKQPLHGKNKLVALGGSWSLKNQVLQVSAYAGHLPCKTAQRNHLGTGLVNVVHKIARLAPLDVLRTCFAALAFVRSLAECRTWSRMHCKLPLHCCKVKWSCSQIQAWNTTFSKRDTIHVIWIWYHVPNDRVMFRTYHLCSNTGG